MIYTLSYDVGTTGLKACLFRVDRDIELLASEYAGYGLYILPNGGAEQDTEEWWQAMCTTTPRLLKKSGISPQDIAGISFCSQMQGLVLVDRDCNAVRRPMSYMDQRASAEMRETEQQGMTVAGVNIFILLKSLMTVNSASTSVKDPLWKYKWVQKNEPDVFKKVYKWLDVKEYLIARLTGRCVMTPDSAYSTWLYDPRPGHECWSEELCKCYGVDRNHLPEVIPCTAVAGTLRPEQAEELGLVPGIKVYGSGGDATLIGVGAGATHPGDTHVYWGTSGWVSTVVEKQAVDIDAMIAGIVGAQQGRYNYFAEMETAGKCFEWVKDHLVLDEVNAYVSKTDVAHSQETLYESLYDYMNKVVEEVPAGCNGVLFAPWLHGNRCPFEDPNAMGMFFNIKLETHKRELIRAVLEGICYHLRWMLECEDKKIRTSQTLRFVGGGALSPAACQMLADITGRRVETVEMTKDIGSIGAAMLVAVDHGCIPSLAEAKQLVPAKKVYAPDASTKAVYDRNYRVFCRLYKTNKKNFEMISA